MEAQTVREMPLYQSHKTVHALKIKGITYRGDSSATLFPEEGNLYAPISVGADFVMRHLRGNDGEKKDFHGGYYVVYSDGYASFSPTDAFEAGYTRL